jgi:hypothetical protein
MQEMLALNDRQHVAAALTVIEREEEVFAAWQAQRSDGKVKSPEPALHPRLKVSLDPAQAIVDGNPIALEPDQAEFVYALLDAKGDWMSGKQFPNLPRADRVRDGLPKPVKDFVESAKFKGFRIALSKLA